MMRHKFLESNDMKNLWNDSEVISKKDFFFYIQEDNKCMYGVMLRYPPVFASYNDIQYFEHTL
jgi:hypothetical protein